MRIRAYISLAIMVLLFTGVVLSWKSDDTKLVVAFLDIGQGDSIYIKSPSGLEMLVDAGPGREVLTSLSKVMRPFDRKIDVIVATHPDKDHIGGIPSVLNNYNTDLFIESGAKNENGVYDEVNRILDLPTHKNIIRKKAYRGQKIDLGSGVNFTIIYPNRDVSQLSTNDASIVGILEYGKHTILLTADAEYMTEYSILDDIPENITILKVGHHGSQTSTSYGLLEKITPEISVISAGENNSYGHPHKIVMDRLAEFKSIVYRTDIMGTIVLKSDGHNIEIVTQK